jgi:hypothetical protein
VIVIAIIALLVLIWIAVILRQFANSFTIMTNNITNIGSAMTKQVNGLNEKLDRKDH